VRNTLKIASVFGLAFTKGELLAVINKDIKQKSENRYNRSDLATEEQLTQALMAAKSGGFLKKSRYGKWTWESSNILQYISDLLTLVRRSQIHNLKEEVISEGVGEVASFMMSYNLLLD